MNLLAATDVDIKTQYFTGHKAASVANTPGGLVSALVPNIIIAAGLIFLFMILFAGFKIIIGAGKQQSAQDAAKAKAALTWSVVGFLIVILGYFILEIVGYIFGLNLTFDWLANV